MPAGPRPAGLPDCACGSRAGSAGQGAAQGACPPYGAGQSRHARFWEDRRAPRPVLPHCGAPHFHRALRQRRERPGGTPGGSPGYGERQASPTSYPGRAAGATLECRRPCAATGGPAPLQMNGVIGAAAYLGPAPLWAAAAPPPTTGEANGKANGPGRFHVHLHGMADTRRACSGRLRTGTHQVMPKRPWPFSNPRPAAPPSRHAAGTGNRSIRPPVPGWRCGGSVGGWTCGRYTMPAWRTAGGPGCRPPTRARPAGRRSRRTASITGIPPGWTRRIRSC